VPREKLESFIQFSKDKLKPFYESHGCKRWELFVPMEVKRTYFPFQTVQEANRYTEQLILNSIEEFENLLEAVEKDPQATELMESFEKKFNVSSCNFTILAQKV